MYFVAALDIVFFLSSITGLIFLLRGWKTPLPRDVKLLLAGLLGFILSYSFCLALEWFGLTKALDPFEDIIGALLPMWWAFLFYAFLREIAAHDLRQSKNRLRANEEKYRVLFDEAMVGYIELDNEGRIINVNKKELEMRGYAFEEMVGRFLWDFTVEKGARERFLAKLSGDMPPSKGLERIICRKDGSLFPVLVDDYIVKDENGRIQGMRTIVRDITDLKQIEQEKERLVAQLQQAHKMEAIGTLAGGIAHDFNNILSPIMIHSEMAMMGLPSDTPVQNSLKQIFKAGERARDLVKQILTFARKQEGERITIEISRILKEAIMLLRSTIPTTIDIRYDIDAEQDTVFADPTQLQQIIMNLCTNATHAMEEKGGILEVILENESLDPESAEQFSDLEPGRFVKLTVKDTGQGIEPEIIDKIFEPYFTTKEVDKGTGMGLALVHGIVKNYGGTITVQSEVGKGTAFHVYLPLVEEDVEVLLETREDSIQHSTGSERILFVDDDKAAVDTIQTMLEVLGYKVIARTSSIEALEAFRNNPQRFDLVVTDMTMPNMTGSELAKELMTIRTDIPIILCTGFSEQIDENLAKEIGIKAFVMKPIVMRDIAQTIRGVLDKK